MANFDAAYEDMIHDEGGYKLTNDPVDRGGMTYAGIARKMNPNWAGWAHVDAGRIPPTQLVRDFYRAGWWLPIRGDEILNHGVAQSIFNFAVNSSGFGKPQLAIKLAQIVVGVTADGDFGAKTLAAVNTIDPALFEAQYALAKIARYAAIVSKDKSQLKYLLGWVNRTLEEAKV